MKSCSFKITVQLFEVDELIGYLRFQVKCEFVTLFAHLRVDKSDNNCLEQVITKTAFANYFLIVNHTSHSKFFVVINNNFVHPSSVP